MIEPRRPQVFWNHLGRQLKMWRAYKVTDAHTSKLMRLWLGYEFTDLLDSMGRWPVHHINEIRRRLGYPSSFALLDDIRRCRSFYIVGIDEGHLTAVFSPVWHDYNTMDGTLLSGSCQIGESQTLSQTFDVSKDINTKDITTVGNSAEFSPEGSVQARRQIVKDYFAWIQTQTSMEHKSLVDDLMYRICNTRDKKGQLIADQKLTEEEGRQMWTVLINTQFVPYFSKREDFFKTSYMQHPEMRIWWMQNFVKKYSSQFICAARKLWRKQVQESIQREFNRKAADTESNRPLSPFEWQDPSTMQRYYHDDCDGIVLIPPDAPPRESASQHWNKFTKRWS